MVASGSRTESITTMRHTVFIVLAAIPYKLQAAETTLKLQLVER
jgi:hypothetical protein